MSEGELCPVCRWPSREGAICGRCGWQRIDDSKSSTTRAYVPDREEQLADCQRGYDLHAAARAAAATRPADRLLLASLAAIVRPGPLSPAQIEKAMADAEKPTDTSVGMVCTLIRLISGKTDAIAFVEIGPDAVSWQVLTANQLGVPVPFPGENYPWTSILPQLPSHVGLRYLRMAGGVGVAPADGEGAEPAALSAAVGDGIVRVLAWFMATAKVAVNRARRAFDDPDGTQTWSNAEHGPYRLDVVLVHRTRDWPLLDEAAAQAGTLLRPITEVMAAPRAGTLADFVRSLATRAPLRYGYDLILVEANRRTGLVRPWSRELFPAGAAAQPDRRPVASVAVSPVTRYTAKQVALPIVARRGPASDLRDVGVLAERRPLIAMAELDATTGGPFQVCVELAGPMQPQILAPLEFLRADAGQGGWPGLIADLPNRLWSAAWLPSGKLDLVLLVELGAARHPDDVAARVGLMQGVVDKFHDVVGAKIAVLGYRDHFGDHERNMIGVPGQEAKALVVGSTGGFTSPEDLQAMMRSDWWSAVPVGHDHAAPLEEALWLLTEDMWDWRQDARHVVLIVGRRPPHPATAQPPGSILPCQSDLPWREALHRLQREQALRCYVVLDDEPAAGYSAKTWRELAAPGSFQIARGTTAQKVAQDLGLAPRSRAQLRLAAITDAASFSAGEREGAS